MARLLADLAKDLQPGLALGMAAAALLSLVPGRVAAGFGLITLTALVSFQAWEQGRSIRFHRAAQWVGWIWPYAGMSYLRVRLAARESGAYRGERRAVLHL